MALDAQPNGEPDDQTQNEGGFETNQHSIEDEDLAGISSQHEGGELTTSKPPLNRKRPTSEPPGDMKNSNNAQAAVSSSPTKYHLKEVMASESTQPNAPF